MSDEITLDGETYISSRRAAEMCGYAQDYIGQLARSSRIDARRVAGLWYVRKQSIMDHQSRSENYVPAPQYDSEAKNADMIHSEDGNEYVSANRASKLSGYNQDYIGQLARGGQIPARQIGNRWYVELRSLRDHKKTKDSLLAAVQADSVGLAKAEVAADSEPQPTTHYSYIEEAAPLLPIREALAIEPSTVASIADIAPEQDVNRVPIRVYRGAPSRIALTPVHDMINRKLAMSAAGVIMLAAAMGTMAYGPARTIALDVVGAASAMFRGGDESVAAVSESSFSLSSFFTTHISYTREH